MQIQLSLCVTRNRMPADQTTVVAVPHPCANHQSRCINPNVLVVDFKVTDLTSVDVQETSGATNVIVYGISPSCAAGNRGNLSHKTETRFIS